MSGIRFAFDGSHPPGQRVDHASVIVADTGEPLDPDARYSLATKAYLAEGKDGYDCLDASAFVLHSLGPRLSHSRAPCWWTRTLRPSFRRS